MKETSDEELMTMFQAGNSMAFDLLFDKYRTPVYNFIYCMLDSDRTASEDLLQNIITLSDGARPRRIRETADRKIAPWRAPYAASESIWQFYSQTILWPIVSSFPLFPESERQRS